MSCCELPPPHVKGWGFVGDCKLCNNLKILRCFDLGMGHTLYTEYAPKKAFNWSAITQKKRMKALSF